jgi:hypothetical protein
MNVISHDGFAVRIPEIPSRYRANCSKEWGCFVTGDTKNMTASEAKDAGLTRGKFVDMAVCWVGTKILTFKPHYFNEPFGEIWGIPVAGEMKEFFHANCSELSTFLIHRQSKDKLHLTFGDINREAFNEWAAAGMNGNPEDFAKAKLEEIYFGSIFRFEMQDAEGEYGRYFWVKTTQRPASGATELAALKIAKDIYLEQLNGINMRCVDLRLEDNQAIALGEAEEQEALPAAKAKKQLKPSK